MSTLGWDDVSRMLDACEAFLPLPLTVHAKLKSLHGCSARVATSDDYQWARVKIDAQQHHGDERGLMATVLHEWLHAAMAPMEGYRDAVNATVTKKQKKVLETVRTNCDERMVVQMTAALLPRVWDVYVSMKPKSKSKPKRSKS